MAGVVAMAAVIEDFDTQPCKKSRKDVGSPVGKTIPNYFPPVPKPAEKPFSPPRKIVDYFSRKAPTSEGKSSPPQQSKDNCQKPHSAEKDTSSEVGKRGRKNSKAARKLVAAETETSRPVAEENKDSAEAVGSYRTLGSNTAALLSKFSAETCDSRTSDVTDAKAVGDKRDGSDSPPESVSKRDSSVALETVPNTTVSSPTVSSRAEVKQVKAAAAGRIRKREQNETKPSEPQEKESDRSLCDDIMEVSVEEASQLNSSTVTISFEDFVRSQSKTEEDKKEKSEEGESKVPSEAEKLNSEQFEIPKSEDSLVAPFVQVSPRTVTIQAEVHVVSPKQEAVRSAGKVASIFNRKKASKSPAEVVLSPRTEDEIPARFPTVKRKSNVVLQEEDLELAVIESESTPKCSEAERKQFMAAFKQPSLDGSKTKPVKGQVKQKPSEEKSVEAAVDEGAVVPSVEQVSQETKKKPSKRGRNKAKDEKEAVTASPAASAAEETVITIDDKTEEPPVASTPSAPALRRSRREAVVRQTPETPQTTPVRKTRRQKELKDAAETASPQDSPIKLCTPKTRRSSRGVFVAEIVCPPDAEESPIRIKFSRVHKTTESGNDTTTKALKESEKQKQAKKLVEKAKLIQQSKKTCAEKETLRRSSRVKTSVKRSYCEDEDSVICVEDLNITPQSTPGKSKTHKTLRSLNEVLGKDPKTVSASKATSLSQDKSARRALGVVSIFDESSREGSENSQDDEQFRARRQFLKSGLPESFRKQIAKTAATKEAYSVSSSSFQPVTHTTQPPDECPLWSLPWPESSLLSHLKEIQTLDHLPSVSGSLCVKTVPACRNFNKKVSGWRPELSESVCQLLMEEFSTSNPHFPAQMFFTRLLKRRADHQITASEPEAGTKEKTCTPLPGEPVGGKRKRREDERENMAKAAKKQKANQSKEKIPEAEPEPPKRGSRTRRGPRSRQEEGKKETNKPSLQCEDDSVIVLDDLILEEDSKKKVVLKEDLLWTDKYQPQHSSDIIDNAAAVKRLYSWLKEWKLRADREERKNQKDKKQEEGSNDSDWDCEDDGEDALCNTVLITGPTGVGKTAAVYACAQELGFKVFEVNASSQRSGRLILSQLKEATQSHQVDSQGVGAYKPTYFNSYGASSSSSRPGSSPRKINSPRKVVSSPRKTPQSPRRAKKGGLAPTSLAKFFKMNQPAGKEPQKPTKHEETVKSSAAGQKEEKSSEEQNKKTATSLILFEEVDVIFDDDSGFLSAIKTFMSTTKRPVILTTSDPAFSTTFDGSFEEIHFKSPSPLNASSYLQLLCLAEDVRTSPSDVGALLKLNGFDIRQSLLQLQFWTCSSGGRRLGMKTSPNAELNPETEEAEDNSSVLPSCDTGCSESKLGLLNIEPERDIWDLLRSRSLMDEAVCLELLTDSKRRGVNLLYSNMETLLPLPVSELTASKLSNRERCVPLSQDEPSVRPNQQSSDTLPESTDCSDGCSPVKVSNRMKRNKKHRCLPDRVGLHSESDSEDGFPSLCKNNPQKAEVKESVKRKLLTAEERRRSLPVSQCLKSIADFWDDMSYMDSSLVFHPDWAHVSRGTPLLSAVIKDGMLDESRAEAGRGSWLTGRVLEIQSAVEALSFHKCRASVVEAWDKVQQLEGELGKEAAGELTLPVAAHRKTCSFTPDGLCQPQFAQQRKEVVENLTFQVFGALGNRDAVALDYLPTMRTICRSEQLKERGKVKRRFQHYLDSIHLGLEKSTLQLLAEEFP